MVRATAVIAPFLLVASFALAAEPPGDVIWQDIAPGDTAAVVAQKLSSVPGIRKAIAKTKGSEGALVEIRYDGDGIPILDDRFKVTPLFRSGGVTQIGLTTEPTCLNTLPGRYAALRDSLTAKYGTPVAGPTSSNDVANALAQATPEQPSQLSTLFASDRTGVVLALRFEKKAPPPPSLVNGRFAAAARNYLWNDYLRAQAECGGTGTTKARIIISYQGRAEFDRIAKETADQMRESNAAAAGRL